MTLFEKVPKKEAPINLFAAIVAVTKNGKVEGVIFAGSCLLLEDLHENVGDNSAESLGVIPGPGLWIWEGRLQTIRAFDADYSDVEYCGTYRAMTSDERGKLERGEPLREDFDDVETQITVLPVKEAIDLTIVREGKKHLKFEGGGNDNELRIRFSPTTGYHEFEKRYYPDKHHGWSAWEAVALSLNELDADATLEDP